MSLGVSVKFQVACCDDPNHGLAYQETLVMLNRRIMEINTYFERSATLNNSFLKAGTVTMFNLAPPLTPLSQPICRHSSDMVHPTTLQLRWLCATLLTIWDSRAGHECSVQVYWTRPRVWRMKDWLLAGGRDWIWLADPLTLHLRSQVLRESRLILPLFLVTSLHDRVERWPAPQHSLPGNQPRLLWINFLWTLSILLCWVLFFAILTFTLSPQKE